MSRGRERLVTCEQCGRQIRRDKAVFIEKPVFSNPLDRSEVVDEHYTRVLTREFAYCPGCGKHFRIYQRKKRMQEQQRERQRFRLAHRTFHHRPRPQSSGTQSETSNIAPEAAEPSTEAQTEQPNPQQTEEKKTEPPTS